MCELLYILVSEKNSYTETSNKAKYISRGKSWIFLRRKFMDAKWIQNSVIYCSRIVRDNKQFWSTEGEDGHMRQTAFEMWEWSNSLFTPYSITRIMSTENKKKERKMWERTIRFIWKMIFVVKCVRSFVCKRVKLSSALFYAFSIWMHLFIQKVTLSYSNLYFIAVTIYIWCYKLLFFSYRN